MIRRPVIVFLHIPKTAGQTLHHQLAYFVGERAVSPVRLSTQTSSEAQFPKGYRLYSGHLDWDALETLPANRFTFTVLRDPLERIASFYLYLLDQAGKLNAADLERPERHGLKMILTRSADDYFFAGNEAWQHFIRDHYDNFYCSYLATRRVRGWSRVRMLAPDELIGAALRGAQSLDRIYTTDALGTFESDMKSRFCATISVTRHYENVGQGGGGVLRWPILAERLESDRARRQLEDFTLRDRELMRRLNVI